MPSTTADGHTSVYDQHLTTEVLPAQLARHHFTATDRQGHQHFYAYTPAYWGGNRVEWSGLPHTNGRPFCEMESCMCHFHPGWVEFFFVRRVASGQMSIEQALDLFYCREGVMV